MDQTTISNHLLQAMDAADFKALTNGASEVPLNKHATLAWAGDAIHYCWFVSTGLISLIATDEDGNEAEVGMVGFEGMANVGAILRVDRSTMRMLVQREGSAVRIERAALLAAMSASDALTTLLLRYACAFSVQVASAALAYSRYTIERRLARWLLMAGDRIGDAKIAFSHEALSLMLGVRRAGVTVATHKLAASGFIRTRRCSITIVDRNRLAEFAGSAYGLPEREVRRLLK